MRSVYLSLILAAGLCLAAFSSSADACPRQQVVVQSQAVIAQPFFSQAIVAPQFIAVPQYAPAVQQIVVPQAVVVPQHQAIVQQQIIRQRVVQPVIQRQFIRQRTLTVIR